MTKICDTTLRDGEQMPGVVFTPEQKMELARRFSDFGVDVIELMPAVSESERQLAMNLAENGLYGKLTASTMLRKEHVQMASDYGFSAVTLFAPVSDMHLKHKLGTSREENLKRSLMMVDYARGLGLRVSFAGEDSTRADIDYLASFMRSMEEGVEYFLPCDTLGCLSPRRTYDFIKRLKEESCAPICLHIHNDFGMATANTLAGIEAGAEMFSGTFSGIGERAGNTPIEEVCVALKYVDGIDLDVDYGQLTGICDLVQRYSGVSMQPHKPVVGENAFSHESGIHVDGVTKFPGTYENFPPEFIGQKRRILFGKHSGRGSLRSLLGGDIPDNELDQILERVKYVSESENRVLSPEDVMGLYELQTAEGGMR